MLNGLEAVFRSPRLQICLCDFESMSTWMIVCPMFKNYLDERLLKKLKDGDGQNIKQCLLNTTQFWQEFDNAESEEMKMSLISNYIKVILRGALRLEPDEAVIEDASMQDLGVDSLLLIELKNSIQSLLGSRLTITATTLKDCNTIRDLAKRIVSKICNKEEDNLSPISPEEFEALLAKDCVLEEDIRIGSPPVDQMKVVRVTGATGQLGPYIVSTLCKPEYSILDKVICLIRTTADQCPREKLQHILKDMNLLEKVDMDRVTCIAGDVESSNFGLELQSYESLCESVDGVIHLAVKSNHTEPYRNVENGSGDIRSVNIGGTLNVLRFASRAKTKREYYASSLLSIFGGNEEGTLCDDWPEEGQTRKVSENSIVGYPASKFVGEMLMKQANDRGIPCKVFRFPWITGDSNTGQLKILNNSYILRFVSYLKIKSMPMTPIPAIILPVDICADLSIKIFWNCDAPNEVYNITHPSPELEVKFAEIARSDFGTEIELVDWNSDEFMQKLFSMDMPLSSLKEIYTNTERAIVISTTFDAVQEYLKSPDNYFKNPKLENAVPGFSTKLCPTMEMIRMNLAYIKSVGLFEKLGL